MSVWALNPDAKVSINAILNSSLTTGWPDPDAQLAYTPTRHLPRARQTPSRTDVFCVVRYCSAIHIAGGLRTGQAPSVPSCGDSGSSVADTRMGNCPVCGENRYIEHRGALVSDLQPRHPCPVHHASAASWRFC